MPPGSGTAALAPDQPALSRPTERIRTPRVRDGYWRAMCMRISLGVSTIEYPKLGFAVEQNVPGDVYDAYERLLRAGFDSRFINS